MLTFFGNAGGPDMPPDLWVDAKVMQELYRLSAVDGYGKVASSRLPTVAVLQGEAAGDDAENTSVPGEERAAT